MLPYNNDVWYFNQVWTGCLCLNSLSPQRERLAPCYRGKWITQKRTHMIAERSSCNPPTITVPRRGSLTLRIHTFTQYSYSDPLPCNLFLLLSIILCWHFSLNLKLYENNIRAETTFALIIPLKRLCYAWRILAIILVDFIFVMMFYIIFA